MIIFYTIPNFKEEFLRFIGGINAPYKPIIDFTLFGMNQQGAYLGGLMPDESIIPSQYIMNDTEPEFDYMYWKQLLENEISQQNLGCILFPEYMYGPDIFICIMTQDTPYRMSITESLINFLNMIYGLDAKLITRIEDLYELDISEYTGFSEDGLRRVTADMIKYTRENPTEVSFITGV